jgi:hypothetical protein
MCEGCWHGDHGAPVTNSEDVLLTAELIRRLYEDHNCPTGGPLHWVLDDMNIDDDQLNNDYTNAVDGRTTETYLCRSTWPPGGPRTFHDELDCTPEVADLCRLILTSLRQMTEPNRAAAIAWYHGWVQRLLRNRAADYLAQWPVTGPGVDIYIGELRQRMAKTDPGPKPCVEIPCPPFTPQKWSDTVAAHMPWAVEVPPPAPLPAPAPLQERARRALVERAAEPDGGWPSVADRMLADRISPRLKRTYPGQAPQVVVAPRGIDVGEVEKAILLCRRVGLLDAGSELFGAGAGYLVLPHSLTQEQP